MYPKLALSSDVHRVSFLASKDKLTILKSINQSNQSKILYCTSTLNNMQYIIHNHKYINYSHIIKFHILYN